MMQAQKMMQPRKLYAQLRACADARARASAVLEFMQGATGGTEGYVLIASRGELVVAASSKSQELPPALMERVRTLWASETDAHSENDMTHTVDSRLLGAALVESLQWRAGDQTYEPRVLGIYRGSRWHPVGVVVLAVATEGLRSIRHAYIDAICNALIDSGDLAGA